MKKQLLGILAGMLWINIALAKPIIIVRGSEDSLSVARQVAQYLDHLDVRENIHLCVYYSRHMPLELLGLTLSIPTPKNADYQVIRVRIDARLSEKEQRLVLAHEMIHVKQYAKRELVAISPQQIRWKGRTYAYRRPADRPYSPWEHEAQRWDNRVAKLAGKMPEAPLTVMQTHP